MISIKIILAWGITYRKLGNGEIIETNQDSIGKQVLL